MHRGKQLALCLCLTALAITAGFVPAANAFVTPMIGGGQVDKTGAPMKHADILFDGTNVSVVVDPTVATPVLRPLTAPNQFDPAQPWSVLTGMDYNYQYAWNPGGFITRPVVGGVTGEFWVERLSSDPGLLTFMRPPQWTSAMGTTWTPLWTADGDMWKWAGAMQHNAYAVLNPTQSTYNATYKVYIGDPVTGAPWSGFGSATATFTFNATPIPEPASLALLALGAAALGPRRNHRPSPKQKKKKFIDPT